IPQHWLTLYAISSVTRRKRKPWEKLDGDAWSNISRWNGWPVRLCRFTNGYWPMHQHKDAMHVQGLARILVIRLSSLGDILLTTPVLRLLREHCPAAQIDFLTKAAYKDLLCANPCVDRVLLFDPQQGLRQTLRILRQKRYDLVVDLHRTLRSHLLSRGVMATRKLTYAKRTARRALLVHLGWNTLRAMTPVPELYAAPLRRVGMTAPLPPLEMHLTPASRDAMRTYVQQGLPHSVE